MFLLRNRHNYPLIITKYPPNICSTVICSVSQGSWDNSRLFLNKREVRAQIHLHDYLFKNENRHTLNFNQLLYTMFLGLSLLAFNATSRCQYSDIMMFRSTWTYFLLIRIENP